MTRHFLNEHDHSGDDPAKLPADRIVTAQQLRLKPGQLIQDRAKELGCSLPTLKIWTAEWRGSGYDPDYVIRRAGHSNWLKNKWKEKDWCELLRRQIAKRQHRHVGDLCLALGLPSVTVQAWSQTHAEFEKLMWAEPHPKKHWPAFLSYVRHSTIDDYRKRKAEHIAGGMDETEAMHLAADEAIDQLKHATRQRRRIERDKLLGVGGHGETLRRYRTGARVTDAHSRRVAKKLFAVSRWVAMERALNERGYSEAEIEEMMSELMGAFKEGETVGQKKWDEVRDAVLSAELLLMRLQRPKESRRA